MLRLCAAKPIARSSTMLINIAHVDSVGTITGGTATTGGTAPTSSLACASAMLFPFVVINAPGFNVLT